MDRSECSDQRPLVERCVHCRAVDASENPVHRMCLLHLVHVGFGVLIRELEVLKVTIHQS